MMTRHFMPFFEADGTGGGGQAASEEPIEQTKSGAEPSKAVEIDYDKIASIVEGKQRVSEESVLKGYFKEQGLTSEEMQTAIASYKEQKQAKTPDIDAIIRERDEALAKAHSYEIEKTAFSLAESLGITGKEMPYVIKMADLSNVTEDGSINIESLKNALNQVLEDIPQLKPSKAEQTGFKKVGSDGGSEVSDKEERIRKAMGL